MFYSLLADFVLVLHFCFVLFTIFGGLLVLRRRSLIWLHLPAIVWGIIVQIFSLGCPLTQFENQFRTLSGEANYSGGFIEHYISMILYFPADYLLHFAFGFGLLVLNLLVYSYIFARRRKMK